VIDDLYDNDIPIKSIWYADGQEGFWVGGSGVTRINMVRSNGQFAPVVWFQVFHGDSLFAMVNSVHVATVYYEQPN